MQEAHNGGEPCPTSHAGGGGGGLPSVEPKPVATSESFRVATSGSRLPGRDFRVATSGSRVASAGLARRTPPQPGASIFHCRPWRSDQTRPSIALSNKDFTIAHARGAQWPVNVLTQEAIEVLAVPKLICSIYGLESPAATRPVAPLAPARRSAPANTHTHTPAAARPALANPVRVPLGPAVRPSEPRILSRVPLSCPSQVLYPSHIPPGRARAAQVPRRLRIQEDSLYFYSYHRVLSRLSHISHVHSESHQSRSVRVGRARTAVASHAFLPPPPTTGRQLRPRGPPSFSHAPSRPSHVPSESAPRRGGAQHAVGDQRPHQPRRRRPPSPGRRRRRRAGGAARERERRGATEGGGRGEAAPGQWRPSPSLMTTSESSSESI